MITPVFRLFQEKNIRYSGTVQIRSTFRFDTSSSFGHQVVPCVLNFSDTYPPSTEFSRFFHQPIRFEDSRFDSDVIDFEAGYDRMASVLRRILRPKLVHVGPRRRFGFFSVQKNSSTLNLAISLGPQTLKSPRVNFILERRFFWCFFRHKMNPYVEPLIPGSG